MRFIVVIYFIFYFYFYFSDLVAGLLSNSLGGLELTCTEAQIHFITPPAGAGTCQDYLGGYVASHTGFLTNPTATGANCGYCQYASGDQYLVTVEATYGQRSVHVAVPCYFRNKS